MNNHISETKELCEFIANSPSCYHVIHNAAAMLKECGFSELCENELWNIAPGQSYYVIRNGSSLAAFHIPAKCPADEASEGSLSSPDPAGHIKSFRLIAAHSDSPSFKIKESPEMERAERYTLLNVEKYGGMLCAPWFDRPLGIAGRLVIKDKDTVKTILADSKRDTVLLPSLAIHMNREANTNTSYKIQSDMLPVFGDEKAKGSFIKMIAASCDVNAEDVLSYDLFLYDRTRASFWGSDNEYFSSPRLDDLQCAFAALKAISCRKTAKDHIPVCCIFDNEEVGSATRQGADSTFLSDVLERISLSLGISRERYLAMLSSSMMLSADNAHAVHPNHTDKSDPVNRPYMNGGVVIKYHANQKYTTDAVSAGIFRMICEKAGVLVQTFFNHSDMPGGSTLGNISSSHVSVATVDIGCAQLAMHSPYETAGIKDTLYMEQAMKAFYESCISLSEC